jgi:hypothetical protein
MGVLQQHPETHYIAFAIESRYRFPYKTSRGSGCSRTSFPGGERDIVKDVVNVPGRASAEVDFVAADPGPLHCRMQEQRHFGFMPPPVDAA